MNKCPKHDWAWEAEFYRTHGVEVVSARASERLIPRVTDIYVDPYGVSGIVVRGRIRAHT